MLTLTDAIVALLVPFATLFTSPTWRKAQLLLVGAILTPGQRTVAAATSATTPATTRCSIGRCGRPARQRASCWCCCSSTWLDFTQNLEEATDAITLGSRHS